jgi:hypothetical protein
MEAIMRRIRLNVFKGNFSLDVLALCVIPILTYQTFEVPLDRSLLVDHTAIVCVAAAPVVDNFAVALVVVGIPAGKADKPISFLVPAYVASCLRAGDQ